MAASEKYKENIRGAVAAIREAVADNPELLHNINWLAGCIFQEIQDNDYLEKHIHEIQDLAKAANKAQGDFFSLAICGVQDVRLYEKEKKE